MSRTMCLVTGATGALGQGLVGELLRAGFYVRAHARREPRLGMFPKTVEIHTGDVRDPGWMGAAVKAAQLVFHLAAKLHLVDVPGELQQEYWAVNVNGTRNLVQACQSADVQRVIFFSTINVYGPTNAAPVDEMIPPCPQGIYAETKHAAEEIVLQGRSASSGKPLGVVLRLAAVYGPHMKGNYPRLIRAMARGYFVPVGPGRNRRTLIYEEDAVRAALLAAQSPTAAGRVYNVSDGRIHYLRDILSAICSATGRPAPRWFLPAGPVRLLAAAADSLSMVTGHPLHLARAIEKLAEDVAVRAEKIQTELGFKPLINLQEGWQRTLAAWPRALLG